MAYEAIEARWQTILQLLTSSFAAAGQVTRGDWSVLDRGYDAIAVLYPGPFEERNYGAGNRVDVIWTTNLQLFQRTTSTNDAAVASFITLRDAVRDHVQKYPKLNGLSGVVAVLGVNATEPVWLYDDNGGGPYFIMCTLDLRVQEENTQTIAGSG